MIRSLRRKHAKIFFFLIIVLPLMYWAGLRARHPIAVMKSVPDPLKDQLGVMHEP